MPKLRLVHSVDKSTLELSILILNKKARKMLRILNKAKTQQEQTMYIKRHLYRADLKLVS